MIRRNPQTVILVLLLALIGAVVPRVAARAEDPAPPPGEIVFGYCVGSGGRNDAGSTIAIQPDGSGQRVVSGGRAYAATSPDGTKVATFQGLEIHILDVKTGALLRTVRPASNTTFGPLGYVSMAWSPDSASFVTLGSEPATSGSDTGWRLFVVDAATGTITSTVRPTNRVLSIAWGASGWLASVITATSPFNAVELIPVGSPSGTILSSASYPFSSPVFDPDGNPAWSGPGSSWASAVPGTTPENFRFSSDRTWWTYQTFESGGVRAIWVAKTDGSFRKKISSIPVGAYVCGLNWISVAPDIAADFTVEEVPGLEPGTFRFTSTTPAVNGFTPTISWNFGDGPTGQDATSIVYRFTTSGPKLVTLTAKLGSATSQKTKTVDVAAPKLELSMDLVDQADAPTIPVVAAGRTEPRRLLRLTAKATNGVGKFSNVTFGATKATPATAVEFLPLAATVPFTLDAGTSKTIDVPLVGRVPAKVDFEASVKGRTSDGVDAEATASARFSVSGSTALESSLKVIVETPGVTARPLSDGSVDIDIKQSEDGVVDPVTVRVELRVMNTGDARLTGLIVPEELSLFAATKGTLLNDDLIESLKSLQNVIPTSLAPGEGTTQFWRYRLKGDGDVRFEALTLADNPEFPTQKLRSVAKATVGTVGERLLKIDIKKPAGFNGTIQAGDSLPVDIVVENLSSKKTLRIGPTFFLRRFGSVLHAGPEEFTDDIDRPGLWSKDSLGPKEKVSLRLVVRTADDFSNLRENFRLDLRTSAQVLEESFAKSEWRDLERKEFVVLPTDGRFVGSVQHSQRAVQDDYNPVLEAVTVAGGVVADQMSQVLFFSYDLEQNPQKLLDGVKFIVGGTLKVGSRMAYYGHRLEPLTLGGMWSVMSPTERAKLLAEVWDGLRQDVPAAGAFAKMTFEEIAKPITQSMDKMADGWYTDNYDELQKGWVGGLTNAYLIGKSLKGDSFTPGDIVTDEAIALFSDSVLRKLVQKSSGKVVAQEIETAVKADVLEGTNQLSTGVHCKVAKAEYRYGTALSVKQAREVAGISERQSLDLMKLARDEDITLTVRAREPESIKLLESGESTLKPEEIKAKGTSQIDIDYFGVPSDNRAKAILVEPPSWASVEATMVRNGVDPASVEGGKILQRHADRVKEWKELRLEYLEMQKNNSIKIGFDGTLNGRPDLNYVQELEFQLAKAGKTADGREILMPMTKTKEGKWVSFTGDVDGVAFLNADGSLIADPEKAARVYRKLGDIVGDASVYNGIALPHAETATCTKEALRDRYLWGVTESFQFSPDAKIRFVKPDQKASRDGFVTMAGGYNSGLPQWARLETPTFNKGVAEVQDFLRRADGAVRVGWKDVLYAYENLDAPLLKRLLDELGTQAAADLGGISAKKIIESVARKNLDRGLAKVTKAEQAKRDAFDRRVRDALQRLAARQATRP